MEKGMFFRDVERPSREGLLTWKREEVREDVGAATATNSAEFTGSPDRRRRPYVSIGTTWALHAIASRPKIHRN